MLLFVSEKEKGKTLPDTNSSQALVAYLSFSFLLVSYHQSCIISLLPRYNNNNAGLKINAGENEKELFLRQVSPFWH